MTTEDAVRTLLKQANDLVGLRFAEFTNRLNDDEAIVRLARDRLQEAAESVNHLRTVLNAIREGELMRRDLLHELATQSKLQAERTAQPLLSFRVTYYAWVAGVDTEQGSIIRSALNQYQAQCDGEAWLRQYKIPFDSTIVAELETQQ